MAALAARRFRTGQSCGSRKEAFPAQTPRGAKVLAGRRETAISRMPEVRIPAFAKINLRLDILGRRSDGYHELRTIFQTISLQDELRLRASRLPGISLSIRGNAVLSREPFQKNLVYRAVDALRQELKIRSGVELELKKTIPAGRGLGGGSSDAAAALLGYLALDWKQPAADRACSKLPLRLAPTSPFSCWRSRSRHQQGRRNLPASGYPEAPLARRLSQRHSRSDPGCLSLAEGSPADIDKIGRKP